MSNCKLTKKGTQIRWEKKKKNQMLPNKTKQVDVYGENKRGDGGGDKEEGGVGV